jgi:chemotaxis protein MotB
MALARARRSDNGMNYWPGFVDALSTLILGIIFLLTVFVVVQFYLQQEVAGKDTALQRLNAQIAQLTDLLSLEKSGKTNLEDQIAQLRAGLAGAEGERDRLKGELAGAGTGASQAQSTISDLTTKLEGEKRISSNALAQRVRELSKYRSDFFGKLREILGNRPDVRIVGDRFVLQSELFFDTGKADLLTEARTELDKVAAALTELEKQIPSVSPWVLRVDGHTDVRPTGTAGQFKSNWDLSAARAIAVVQYLVGKGVSPQRLVAAGFGEFQPIDTGTTEDAYRRNRRIEFKLTER